MCEARVEYQSNKTQPAWLPLYSETVHAKTEDKAVRDLLTRFKESPHKLEKLTLRLASWQATDLRVTTRSTKNAHPIHPTPDVFHFKPHDEGTTQLKELHTKYTVL